MLMKRVVRILLAGFAIYACWVGMMLVHETGHVLHAWATGGVVERVTIPPAGFSLTTYAVNPRPHVVAWGGPVWGCVIPLLLLAAATPASRAVRRAAQFFAGFCLVANGVYLGVGWTTRAGDAGELLRFGSPRWVLVAFGACATGAGLYLWHRLGVPAPHKHARNRTDVSSPTDRHSHATPVSERTREDPDLFA